MEIELYHASKFGNGEKVAEEIKRLMVTKGNKVNIHHIKEVSPRELPLADLYIFGSPTRFGKAPGGVMRFIKKLELSPRDTMIGDVILKEIRQRLGFLQSVGLQYLSLARSAGSLSGGESQRIRLATQIGSSLMGVLYILDEPSIGLHPYDNQRLLASLRELRDRGNTVLVVEHDPDRLLLRRKIT